jgi:hypothetical protein
MDETLTHHHGLPSRAARRSCCRPSGSLPDCASSRVYPLQQRQHLWRRYRSPWLYPEENPQCQRRGMRHQRLLLPNLLGRMGCLSLWKRAWEAVISICQAKCSSNDHCRRSDWTSSEALVRLWKLGCLDTRCFGPGKGLVDDPNSHSPLPGLMQIVA